MCRYLPLILLIFFATVVFFLLLYYACLFARFLFHKQKKIREIRQDSISIVIASCDQAHHLLRTLPAILSQHYNDFEVIVVDDNSQDDTKMVVEDFQKQYANLRFVELNTSVTNIKGKKFPLSIGIKEARNKLIVLTDPDCMPASQYWLQNMAKHFAGGKQIVLGYSTYERKKGVFNRLLRYDSLQTAIQYFSFALARMPFMGRGQNLAYTKDVFYKQKGFASHNHIIYGDDDIFVGKASTKTNCDIEYFSESFTVARPKASFGLWFREKKGYITTRQFYKPGVRFLLDFFAVLNLLFYVSFGFALAYTVNHLNLLIAVISVFAFKLLLQYLLYGFIASRLKEKEVIPYILFLDILHIFFGIFIYLSAKLSKQV